MLPQDLPSPVPSLVQRKASSAVLERTPLSAEQRQQLAELVGADGLYRLRLPAAPGSAAPLVATSFPARCLAAAAAPGGLEVDLLAAGSSSGASSHVAGIAIGVPCRRGGAAGQGLHDLPASQDLTVRLPAGAPEVLPVILSPGQAGAGFNMPLEDGAAAAGQAGQSQQQQQAGAQQGQGGSGAAAGGKAGAAKKAEEEKTWLQKNWMLVAPLGVIVSGEAGGRCVCGWAMLV